MDEAIDYKDGLRTQTHAIYYHCRVNEKPFPNTDHPDLELDAASQNDLPNINNLPINSVEESTETVLQNRMNESNGSQTGQFDVENNSEQSLLKAIHHSNENDTSTESFFSIESTNNSNMLEKSHSSNSTDAELESDELVSQIKCEDVSFIGISSTDQMELSYLLHLSPNENDAQHDFVHAANEQTTSVDTPIENVDDCGGASGCNDINMNDASADDDSEIEFTSVGSSGFPKPRKYCNEIVHTKYENDSISGNLAYATRVYISKQRFIHFLRRFFNVEFVFFFTEKW